MLEGVRFSGEGAETHSMVMRVKTRTVRTIETQYHQSHESETVLPDITRAGTPRG
jgi:fructose-1,6-bisphosphatase/sedoheptulose 1,7-bisphosphatase-like protein